MAENVKCLWCWSQPGCRAVVFPETLGRPLPLWRRRRYCKNANTLLWGYSPNLQCSPYRSQYDDSFNLISTLNLTLSPKHFSNIFKMKKIHSSIINRSPILRFYFVFSLLFLSDFLCHNVLLHSYDIFMQQIIDSKNGVLYSLTYSHSKYTLSHLELRFRPHM